jgi:HAE1 family hydrophobic/amphiphilic exporter-1
VLIAHVIDLRASGMSREAAILQAGRDRLRPILMTTMTTLLGMLPLAVGDASVGGGGSEEVPRTTRWRAQSSEGSGSPPGSHC